MPERLPTRRAMRSRQTGQAVFGGSVDQHPLVYRLTDTGALDTTFNTTGHMTFDFPGAGTSFLSGLAVQPSDSKIGSRWARPTTSPPGSALRGSPRAALARYVRLRLAEWRRQPDASDRVHGRGRGGRGLWAERTDTRSRISDQQQRTSIRPGSLIAAVTPAGSSRNGWIRGRHRLRGNPASGAIRPGGRDRGAARRQASDRRLGRRQWND